MRHRKAGVKLNRTSSHRKAMFRNMVTSLLKHEKIKTTDVKAKALRSWIDHIITLAKRGDLHARRQALAIVREKKVVHKLFAEAAAKFGERQGGYTRITKLGIRKGDAAPISIIELITEAGAPKKKLFKEDEKELVAPTVAAAKPATEGKETPETPPAKESSDAGAKDQGIEVAPAEAKDTVDQDIEKKIEDASGEGEQKATEEKPGEK